jgi:hypothetical protein
MLTLRAEPAKEHWAMPVRTGREYIEGLREQRREVWLRGERVKDVTTQPGLAGGVRAIVSLYDMQHDAKVGPKMTYVSPLAVIASWRGWLLPPERLEHVLDRDQRQQDRHHRQESAALALHPPLFKFSGATFQEFETE